MSEDIAIMLLFGLVAAQSVALALLAAATRRVAQLLREVLEAKE